MWYHISHNKKKGLTMSRLKELRKYVDNELNQLEDAEKRNSAIVHLYGVSLAATMIAEKRGLNSELSSMAATLHDDKHVIDSPMDEVLKDADVIHHCMNDLSKAVKDKEKSRYEKLRIEFGMQ